MGAENTPEAGSNFSLGFLFLPPRKREALKAVYAFCRVVDDIVDSGESDKESARSLLAFWDEEIDKLYSGRATHALARRLEPFVAEFRLPQEGFRALIAGMRMDLERSSYETIADLEKYLFGAAGAVGLLCVEIFGYARTSPADIRAYAVAMGNAFQLTNILRDLGADLERGRIYLPREDFRVAGCLVEEFSRREHSPAFRRLMEAEYARAKGYYREARARLHPDDRRTMLPAEVMAHIYEGLLDKLRDEDFRVFFRRVGLPSWKKALLAARAWAASR
ncbi:MAG TPA: squalene synthase HpnD [Elusimicrobia bacterium]|nr:squalene synthase HpnD [Elusimicrobiota bacterium]